MALDAIDRVTVGKQGGDKRSEEYKTNRNNVTDETPDEAARGNANTYALRKLRKDRPDLHQQVLDAIDRATVGRRGGEAATTPRPST